MSTRRPWTDADIALLRFIFPHCRTADVARVLERTVSSVRARAALFGLRKSAEFFSSPAAQRADGIKGTSTRFKPGHATWCKGTKGVMGQHPASRATQFKPGRAASEARNYLPIGSLRINADGYLKRKVTDDTALFPARRWVAVHRLVWEAAHGPVPDGHVVVFHPGKKTTELDGITLDVIELVTRRELMRRNSVHQMPKELVELVRLRGVLTRHINTRAKEAETP